MKEGERDRERESERQKIATTNEKKSEKMIGFSRDRRTIRQKKQSSGSQGPRNNLLSGWNTHTYTHIHTHRERERERERAALVSASVTRRINKRSTVPSIVPREFHRYRSSSNDLKTWKNHGPKPVANRVVPRGSIVSALSRLSFSSTFDERGPISPAGFLL